ncbi:MAG: hypothetical protein Kow0077_14730 [Anaerolineae bacterium]
MTHAFDKLCSLLDSAGTLTTEDIVAVEEKLGPMTGEERLSLSIALYERMQRDGASITLDQYVEAANLLDSAEPGSPEYERARAIVEAFESAA